MAVTPHAMRLRVLKYSPKVSSEERIAAARLLLAAGQTTEALDLFLLAGDEAAIREIEKLAVSGGHPHLLLSMRRYGRECDPATWKATGEAAAANGRWCEAYRAFSEAGDEAGLARVDEVLPGYAPFKPQGK
ncbi:MAG: hypothetical protein V3T86_02725 [Planctomycetota bacterium]